MTEYFLNELGIVCAAGDSHRTVYETSTRGEYRVRQTSEFSAKRPCFLGYVDVELESIPSEFRLYASRNTQLALTALLQINEAVQELKRVFGSHRIAVVMGTSTSGVRECELALRRRQMGNLQYSYHYKQQELACCAEFIAAYLELKGPVSTVSTACSSSLYALASARRLLDLNVCDAVIVGGADSLCEITVQGFMSLNAVSAERCKPLSKNRDGINIGEGAALFVMSKKPSGTRLCGIGLSSDAYHMSAPDPEGVGAVLAMQRAMSDARMTTDDIDYINLHGTATRLNDDMESKAVNQLFGDSVWCSSSKGVLGHTLGAAGAIELGICWLCLENKESLNVLPRHIWDGCYDADLPRLKLVESDIPVSRLNVCMTNSFGFGGSNASAILGRLN